MIDIQKIDHVGIRVSNKDEAIAFYEKLGFKLITDIGFEKGHPVIMQHPCSIVINLLGPGHKHEDGNVLMDTDDKFPGYTHMAVRVSSLEDAKKQFAEMGIELSGSFSFKGLSAVFVRDPDGNVIEFDEYDGDEPDTRTDEEGAGYENHP